MAYRAPVDDIMFALKTAAGLDALIADGCAGSVDRETVEAILGEAGKFAEDVLDPLNKIGDAAASRLIDGKVVTPPGWKEAYDQFAAGGWSALPCPEEFGGQGLPCVVAMAASEIWNSANLAFGVCPLLTNGAIDSIDIAGSDELKRSYLPNLVSGRWTGTMNLTEPQAGSDLNAVQSRAERAADGTYRIFGTKIFISYGDHDLTENIIHLVLARLPDAPPGTRGLTLFLVPKRLVNADGSLGEKNDVVCAGLEHKLGIRASPTAVLKFGETKGAVGYAVGDENRGLATMFIMMNAARLAVGTQGVAIAERSTQHAMAYAKERRQGRGLGSKSAQMAPIVAHADVRRMLMTMKSLTQAARAICFATARDMDVSRHAAEAAVREAAANRMALMIPIAKAFSTDVACEVSSLGIQIHGGMGFVEETGAAQYYRDARILPIYEGTNGIHAIDLLTRKLMLGGGDTAQALFDDLRATVREVQASNASEFGHMGERLAETLNALVDTTHWMDATLAISPQEAMAGATPFLRLFGLAVGGHHLARGALAASATGNGADRVAIARFFAENISVAGPGLASAITSGAGSVLALEPEVLAG